MTEAEEQLGKVLGRVKDGRLRGVGPLDVEPSLHPGHVVLKKRCRCALKSIIYMAGMEDGAGFHHHLVEIPKELWERLSEEQGWPQNRWKISE